MGIIKKIKKKRELSSLDDSIVKKALDAWAKRNNFSAKDINSLNSRDFKVVVKEVRASLRRMAGQFNSHEQHLSSQERSGFYRDVKEIIQGLEVKSILDLGSGLNPIHLDLDAEYTAVDIDSEIVKKVSMHFKKFRIPGRAFIYDLREIKAGDFKEVDLCILFKVLDILESKGHKLAEKILLAIKARYFLISFPTKTLSGRPMNHPQRGWIERLLSRLGFFWARIEKKNEIFYLASKEPLPSEYNN